MASEQERLHPRRAFIRLIALLAAVAMAKGCGNADAPTGPPPPETARATTVAVNPATAELASLGSTTQLSAEVRDQSGTVMAGAAVAWSSGSVAVATVSATGLVTAVGNGTATVTASAGAASGTSAITVENPDRAALVALYEATDGPNWRNSDNWLTDAPLQEWYGVDTDHTGRVVRLDLAGRRDGEDRLIPHGLKGPVPAELGSLSRLTSLNLRANSLTGPTPSELGRLSELTSLNLGRNDLTGSIPPELGSLSRLTSLELDLNNLTGTIPAELGSLSRLTSLNLRANSLAGPIPPELGSLSQLTRLLLSWNALTGPLPSEFGGLASLRDLSLKRNELTGPLPSEIGRLTNLVRLNLDGNNLSGPIPRSLLDLGDLTRFYFESSAGDEALCAPGIAEFAQWLEAMTEAEGPYCNESDTIVLESLFESAVGSNWTNSEGWLDGPVLTGWHGVTVDSVGQVTALDLSRNGLSGRLPGSLGELAHMVWLRIAGNAELSGPLPLSLADLSLRTLSYDGTGLCVSGSDSFQRWLNAIGSHEGTGVECGPWTLSGTVSRGWADPESGPSVMSHAGRFAGAVVEVVDGPDAGHRATTDDSGRYVLEALEHARLTVRVTATGFASVERTLDLASDTALAFSISRELPPPGPPATFPDTDPAWMKTLALDYPYRHQVANVRVSSDISLDFSIEHAEHLRRVWDFFNGLYAYNRGDYYEAYYTQDPDVYLKAGTEAHCGEERISTVRNVNLCHGLDYPRWFIIPHQIPDFGTQLHEFGHSFLSATVSETRSVSYGDIGWFVEGTAMYFEGGVFNDSGSLRVPTPLPWCSNGFQRFDQQDRLNPLARLLHAPERGFWGIAGGYQQTCMLFDYLERHEPGVLYALIDRINSGQVFSNDDLVTALLDLAGKSISELEEAYEAHARQWVPSNRNGDA
jgi:hypothetical protein